MIRSDYDVMLSAIDGAWPRAACPTNIPNRLGMQYAASVVGEDHVAAWFCDSALRYLLTHADPIGLAMGDDEVEANIRLGHDRWFIGHSLLGALDLAIRELRVEGGSEVES